MWRFSIILIGGGIALGIYGFREYSLGKDSSATAEAITIEELEDGVPPNPHRRVGPHVAVFDNVVYSERNGRVEAAYYAIVSRKALEAAFIKAGVRPDDKEAAKDPAKVLALVQALPVKVIVKTHRWTTIEAIKAETEAPDADFRTELVGMVINRIQSLPVKESELVKKGTPSFDPATTVIIEEGRTPTSTGLAIGLIALGVALAVSPLVIWLIQRATARKTPSDEYSPTDE